MIEDNAADDKLIRSRMALERVHVRVRSSSLGRASSRAAVVGDGRLYDFGSTVKSPSVGVSEAVRMISGALDGVLQGIWVEGEAAEIYRSRNGHVYFKLKDELGILNAVVFAGRAASNPPAFKQGDKIEVLGDVTVYPKTGSMQLTVSKWRRKGLGAIYEAFLRLKKSLEAEGLFSAELKKPLPVFPRRAALVTSSGSAAWHDVVRTIQRRTPWIELETFDSVVQGPTAAESLAEALRRADEMGFDVVLLVRGGGAYEDLQAFNDEMLARTIRAMNTPVVCGVGHESDETIADYVSDLRASTPTAAAESICPDKAYWESRIFSAFSSIQRAFGRSWENKFAALEKMERIAFAKEDFLRDFAGAFTLGRRRLDEAFHSQHALRMHRAAAVLGLISSRSISTEALSRSYAALDARMKTAARMLLQKKSDDLSSRTEIVLALGCSRAARAASDYASLRRLMPKASELLRGTIREYELASKALMLCDPDRPLSFGFARVVDDEGRWIKSAEEASSGCGYKILMNRGSMDVVSVAVEVDE